MAASLPYSLKIFLPDGDPDGIRTIEKSNWSGSGVMAPRSLFAEVKKRKELSRTGVYVLLGPAEDSGLPRIYVGEGDPIRPRLESHSASKDFWTSFIAFSSKDENLNKAHVQYLETRLIELATRAKRCSLDNGNQPQPPSLSEVDAADAEGFLAEMLLCFPVLGVGVFTEPKAGSGAKLTFYIKGRGVSASGRQAAEGFVVLSGGKAAKAVVPSCDAGTRALRGALIKNGVLVEAGGDYSFTQDYVFTSPSAAGCVVLGRSTNGRAEWKTTDGKSLKQIQEAEESE